jgi:hypothetical protein
VKVSMTAQVRSSTVAATINTLVTVSRDNCTVSFNHISLSTVMLCGAVVCFHSFAFIEYLVMKEIFMIPILIACYVDITWLSTAVFVTEIDSLFDSFSGVTCNRDHGKVLLPTKQDE